jgi:hypothetical protein
MHNFLRISEPTTLVIVPFHVNLKHDKDFDQHLAIYDDEVEFLINNKEITCDGFLNLLTIEQCKNIVLSDDECSLQEMFECFGEENIYIIENFQGTFNVSAVDEDGLINFKLEEFFYGYIEESVDIVIDADNYFNLKEISFEVFSKMIDLKIDEPRENFEPIKIDKIYIKNFNHLNGLIPNLDFEEVRPSNIDLFKPKTVIFLPFFVEQPKNERYIYIRLNPFDSRFDPKQILTLVTIKQCLSIDFGESNIFDAIGEHTDMVNIIENFNGEISYNPIEKTFKSSKESNFKSISFIEFGRLLDENKFDI